MDAGLLVATRAPLVQVKLWLAGAGSPSACAYPYAQVSAQVDPSVTA